MTHFSIIPVFIISAAILTSIGCGDEGEGFGSQLCDETCESTRVEEELELACESFCDTSARCRVGIVLRDCVERCVTEYSDAPDAATDGACANARIDLLNCFSSQSCSSSVRDIESECPDAFTEVRATCGDGGLGTVELVESGPALVEITERELSDAEEGVEETDPADEGEDEGEESENTDDPGLIEIVEIPEPEPIFELPWL